MTSLDLNTESYLEPILLTSMLYCFLTQIIWKLNKTIFVKDLYSPDQLPDYRCQAERDWASLVAQMVKNPPAVQEPWVQSLGWEDPLEEGMATHSRILAWRIHMDRGAGYKSMESQRVGHDWVTKHSTERDYMSPSCSLFTGFGLWQYPVKIWHS